jgi:peptide chain release factor 1
MFDEILRSLPSCVERLEALTARLQDPKVLANPREAREVGRERQRMAEVVGALEAYDRLARALEEAREIVRSSADAELVAMARTETEELESREAEVAGRARRALLPRDPDDDKSVIVEIRAGEGGEEAALFAADLFRMYSRYAQERGWKVEILDSSATGIGGFKEIVFSVEGAEAYAFLKFESGVHRVQRVPETEASGRIHTSAATVAVLPEAEEVDVQISPEDLKIDVFRSSGPGGQSVNTADSAVRIKHLPTGIVVQCQDERSQLKNKNKALKVLRAKLLDIAREEQDAKIRDARRSQVLTGGRNVKIRTYNFPQSRVTDHRIGLSLHKLPQILQGDLDGIIEALRQADAEEKLRAAG